MADRILPQNLDQITGRGSPNRDRMIKAFKADLAGAGIDYEDASGRVIDFHALRHTTGSLLAASGVHPK